MASETQRLRSRSAARASGEEGKGKDDPASGDAGVDPVPVEAVEERASAKPPPLPQQRAKPSTRSQATSGKVIPPPLPSRPSGSPSQPGGSATGSGSVPPPLPKPRFSVPAVTVKEAAASLPSPSAEAATVPPRPLPNEPTPLRAADLLPKVPTEKPPVASTREDAARELIEDCSRELTGKPDRLRAARLHYEIGRLHEYPLGQPEEAVEHFQKAHALAREDLHVLRALRRALLAQQQYEAAIPLFDREARLSSDPHTRARLLLEKGRLQEERLGQPAAAREAFRSAVTFDANTPDVLKAAERSARKAGDWAQVSRTLEKDANVYRSPTLRAALRLQRAHVLETRLGQPDLAVEQYEAALEDDPGNTRALVALKRLYHARGRLRDRVRMLELEAKQNDDPLLRSAALYEAAKLWSERLGNRLAAIEAIQRALEARPDELLLLDELSRLLEEEQDYRGLVEVLARRVEVAGDPHCVPLLHRLGQLCQDRLEDDAEAARYFERALRQDPTYVPALQGLSPLYLRQRRHEELIQAYLREADATGDSQRRAAAHARVARICETQLGDLPRAAAQHERALAAVDLFPESFRGLTRLYSTLGRYRELAELYERAVEGSQGEPAEAVLQLLRIGAIHETHLDDPVEALHAYERALALDAENLEAIQSLSRVAERCERHGVLVTALEREAEITTSPERRVALLQRAGEVLDEALHDRERALSTLKRVLELAPGHPPALAALGRIYYRSGRWEDLLGVYAAELEQAEGAAQSSRLHMEMGELCERHLGRHEEATEHYRAAGELTPEDPTATEALGRKLHEQQAWPELLELWQRAADRQPAAADRALAHFRRAEILEAHLSRIDQATQAYEEALAAQPDFRPALSALARLRFVRGEWAALAEQLWSDAERLQDSRMQVTALARASALYRDQLGDLDRCVQGYERVLQQDPAQPEALLALETVARERDDVALLKRVLDAQAHTLPDDEARRVAMRELCRVQRREGDDQALRATLEALLEQAPEDAEALELLESLALRSGDGALLRQVDETLARLAGDRTVRAAHLARLAQSLEDEDTERALTLYREALADDPQSVACVRGMSRLAQQAGAPELLSEAAEGEQKVVGDRRRAAMLRVQAGRSLLQFGAVATAIDELELALELDPDSAAAAHHLREAMLRDGQHARLVQQLHRAAGAASDPAHGSRLWCESARISADVASDLPGAISALRRSLRRHPEDAEAEHMLATMLERDGHWSEAMKHFERVLGLDESEERQVSAHMRLAQLAQRHGLDDEKVAEHLRAVLELKPRHREALRQLSDVLSRNQGDSDEAAQAVLRLVETADSDAARVAALLQLARVEERRGNRDKAALALIEAVAVDGPGSGAGAAFRDAIDTITTWKQYAAAIDRFLATPAASGANQSNTYLTLARVCADELDDPERALAALEAGSARHPLDLALQVALADGLTQSGRCFEASEALRSALRIDVERPQSWRALGPCLAELHGPDAESLALDALVVLGSANKQERRRTAERKPSPAAANPGSLHVDAAPELLAGLPPRGVGDQLLQVLSEGLGKLYPPSLDKYGVSSRGRLTVRSNQPLRLLADRIATIVGAPEFDLYLASERGALPGVLLTDPLGVLVPESLAEQKESVQVFTLTRLLSSIASGLHGSFTLTPRELEILLASYGRNVAPQFGEGLTSEDVMNDQARRIHRALPRRLRKQAEELAREYVTAPISPFAEWLAGRERVALRAAALLSDDLPAVAELLSLAQTTPVEAPQLTDLENGVLTDMLHFWVAAPTLALRERAGLPRVGGRG